MRRDHPAPNGRQTRLVTKCNRRRGRCLVVGACALLTVVAVAGVPVYVRPQIDRLRPADAIFVLGGDGYRRYPYGIELGTQGWAPNVVLSNPRGDDDPRMTAVCASRPAGVNVRCFVPDPSTTKGEGRELRRLADENGWRTVIVVTFRPHISRARYILEQCFDGDLVMVASPARLGPVKWAYNYGYQTAGYVRATLTPGC